MTDAEARDLHPGDLIRLRPQPTWATNPPSRTTFTLPKVDFRAADDVRIVSIEGFRFAPWEVEGVILR